MPCEDTHVYDGTNGSRHGRLILWTTGPKTFISFYKSYLVLVSPPNIPAAASRAFGVHAAAVSANDTTKLTIIDTANKFTAYQATFMQGIRSVICEWGSIYIVENGGKVSLSRTAVCFGWLIVLS
jgi:hypothetical protein